jgi:hypothetical protein
VQQCWTILLTFVNNRCSTILWQPVFINIATTNSWFLRVYAGEEKRFIFRFRHVFWQFPGNSCDTGFPAKIPAIWQCQDSMLSQKVEFEVIWRELSITLLIKDKLSDKIRSSKICGCHFTGNFFLIFIQFYRRITCVRNGLANNEFD